MITEAMNLVEKKEEGKTVIYTAMNSHWERFGPARAVRPLDSVILEKGVKEFLLQDIKDFFSRADWYKRRGVKQRPLLEKTGFILTFSPFLYGIGIPYRRGYLLYGPPGSGKTATITALAGHLNMSICIVNLSNNRLSDEGLTVLLNKTPTKRCVILLEG